MKRSRAGKPALTWEQGPDGRWRAVRTVSHPRAPARSERVSRVAGAEDEALQLAELSVGIELFGVLAQRFGAAPTALAFAYLMTRKKRR